ncbi:MAG: hypothetical protein C5B56_00515 [Proteobacteria bacterium]|nr:MAG: hypothetical protein C5B56_00515 [Pseudomonadota bacterium]
MAAGRALAKVTIYEIAERPWGWLLTTAEVDDRVYVGSREWRAARPEEWAAIQAQLKTRKMGAS